MENLLSVEGAAQALGLAVSTLNKYRVAGTGPRFVKLGRAVRYRPADLDAWIAANGRRSTSEEIEKGRQRSTSEQRSEPECDPK